MDYFSNDYRNRLINEHKLVSASIAHLNERYKQYASQHGVDVMAAAITSLRSQKVELEVKIDVLSEFLHS